jgi:ABC-type Mn2+/Zn2+ transport system permease subunit
MDTLLEILNPNFLLRNALYGGLIIGLVAPAVGVFLLARRLVFIGIALPQVSTAGVAAAFVWHTYFHGHLNRDVSDFVLALVGSSILTFAVILVLALLDRHAVCDSGRGHYSAAGVGSRHRDRRAGLAEGRNHRHS